MPQVIQGYEVRTLPKNTNQESYPVFIQVPAGTTINDQNVICVTVTAGAAGVCDISAQVVRFG